jgi:hypothetical protein
MESEIDLEALRTIADLLIKSAAAQLKTGAVRIADQSDFYWEVPLELQNATGNQPPKLDVGRLSDDWDFIKGIATDPQSATPLNLLHLTPILNYLALLIARRK